MNSESIADLRARVYRSVFDEPGHVAPAVRRSVAAGSGVPGALESLVEKIHRHAYRVTDEDLGHLRASHTDDQLFEIVVSAALGAARQRLDAGLAALERA